MTDIAKFDWEEIYAYMRWRVECGVGEDMRVGTTRIRGYQRHVSRRVLHLCRSNWIKSVCGMSDDGMSGLWSSGNDAMLPIFFKHGVTMWNRDVYFETWDILDIISTLPLEGIGGHHMITWQWCAWYVLLTMRNLYWSRDRTDLSLWRH